MYAMVFIYYVFIDISHSCKILLIIFSEEKTSFNDTSNRPHSFDYSIQISFLFDHLEQSGQDLDHLFLINCLSKLYGKEECVLKHYFSELIK